MRRSVAALLLGLLAPVAGCVDEPETHATPAAPAPAAADQAKSASSEPALVLPERPIPEDLLGAIAPVVEAPRVERAFCVQIRSVPSDEEARALMDQIRTETGLPVTSFEADLGDRGVWHRICVGAEPSEAKADARARSWTKPGGLLRPYMTVPEEGHAPYFIKPRPGLPGRLPTFAQARTLWRGVPDDARRVHLAERGADKEGFLAALTVKQPGGRTDVLLVDAGGRVLPLSGAPEAGCAACKALLEGGASVGRRVLSVADVGPWPGEEVLVAERVSGPAEGESSTVLSVVSAESDAAIRRAWVLLGSQRPGLTLIGEARPVEADGAAGAELALLRTELFTVDDRLCALRTRGQILQLTAADGGVEARELDESFAAAMAAAEQGGGAKVAAALVRAFDEIGDPAAASRICAAYLARGTHPEVSRLCIRRIGDLLDAGRLIEATNAAGRLAEASVAFRAAVAGPFYRAASRLQADGRLQTAPPPCSDSPLVERVSKKRLEHVINLARARLEQRLYLSDVVDAVFVTGARDFGPKTPVGELTGRWLERLREVLPARYAAIQALLLPPPAPKGSAQQAPPDRPADGIRIEVHDERSPGSGP